MAVSLRLHGPDLKSCLRGHRNVRARSDQSGEKLGQNKGCGFPGFLEWRLCCIFIQLVECSLGFADSRADP